MEASSSPIAPEVEVIRVAARLAVVTAFSDLQVAGFLTQPHMRVEGAFWYPIRVLNSS